MNVTNVLLIESEESILIKWYNNTHAYCLSMIYKDAYDVKHLFSYP